MKYLLRMLIVMLPFAASTQNRINGIKYPVHIFNDPAVKKIKLQTGVSLEYAEKGNADGVPVIMLHGITDSWHSFEKVLEHLPNSIRAFAITQRGHGDSERPAGAYTPSQFAADVAAFITQLNLGPVVIVGHSMGGVNALRFAIDYPHLTKAIVIIASDAAFIKNPGMSEFLNETMQMEGNITWEYMNAFQLSTLARPIDSAYFNLIVSEGLKTPLRIYKSALFHLLEEDFTGQLSSIKLPALIIWGNQDAICKKPGQDLLVSEIRNNRFLIYEGHGHAVHWEAPAKFSKDLIEFIKEVEK